MGIDCQLHQKPASKQPQFLHLILPGNRAFFKIYFDHVGLSETFTLRNNYILIFVDNLTIFCQIIFI